MPTQYKYSAVAEDGRRHTGVLPYDDRDLVLDKLRELRLTPISLEEISPKRPFSLFGFSGKRYYDTLIAFTSHLSTLFKAGVPLLRALSLIKVGGAGSYFSRTVSDIREQVQAGRSLSQAMRQYDDLFPRVYVASIAAGEESGQLDDILDELSVMLDKELGLTRALKSGVRYPLIVITAIIAAVLVLIMYVMPKFMAFYDQFRADLPLPTRILIGAHDLFAAYWPYGLGGLIVLVIGFKKLMSNQQFKHGFDSLLLKVPIFGNLIIKGNVARFTMMFHILFQSGLSIVFALELLADSIKNSAIGFEVRKMADLLRTGRDADLVKSEFRYFPELALQMITIGLESGSLPQLLKQISNHYSQEVEYTTKNITAILEPILTVVLGVFVLIMALAIFLPMWNLIKVFNG